MSKGYYRELIDILTQHGCVFVRSGKGSHEIWFSPISAKKLLIPRNCPSSHTANSILKDAGLPKAF